MAHRTGQRETAARQHCLPGKSKLLSGGLHRHFRAESFEEKSGGE